MGLLKRCDCVDTLRCSHPWHAELMHKGQRAAVALAQWDGEQVRTKTEAETALSAVKDDLRKGVFSVRGCSTLLNGQKSRTEGMTVQQLVDEYWTRYASVSLRGDKQEFDWRTKP